jgi:hypothetical protein
MKSKTYCLARIHVEIRANLRICWRDAKDSRKKECKGTVLGRNPVKSAIARFSKGTRV